MMNLAISPIAHGRGLVICCSGRRCRWESAPARNRRAGCWSAPGWAASADNGSQALAPSTLNMLPKFELAPMRMYFRMFTNTLRPSSTPSSSTIRFFSSKNHVGGFLGDVHRVVHGNAHVGGPQRRRVVDAVAHEPDDVPCCVAAPARRAFCASATGARKHPWFPPRRRVAHRSCFPPGCRAGFFRRECRLRCKPCA